MFEKVVLRLEGFRRKVEKPAAVAAGTNKPKTKQTIVLLHNRAEGARKVGIVSQK